MIVLVLILRVIRWARYHPYAAIWLTAAAYLLSEKGL